MLTSSAHPNLRAHQPLSPQDAAELADLARRLRQLAQAGAVPPLLRGKNIGLLRASHNGEVSVLLLQAARALGAHVATMRWSLSGASQPGEVRHTGRMLGRLYDALVCQGMAPEQVRQVGLAAGIPVFDDIAADGHPSAGLADALGGDAPASENRRFVLQALLVDGLA
jgi:ornithine carbamoyltransferase